MKRVDRHGIDHSTYHDALAPFATTTAAENAAFLEAMDRGLAERRARRARRGGTEAGAPCAGDEEIPSDAGEQE